MEANNEILIVRIPNSGIPVSPVLKCAIAFRRAGISNWPPDNTSRSFPNGVPGRPYADLD
jgi:hypothetical protein